MTPTPDPASPRTTARYKLPGAGPLPRLAWSYLRRHPGNTLLMVLGIALGVAVVVAIDLANNAATGAFDLSVDAVAGRATHQIVGGPLGLDEAVYTRLRVEGGVRQIAPLVIDYLVSPQMGNRPLQLLGVDPFAEGPFRGYLSGDAADRSPGEISLAGLTDFFTRPGALLLSEDLAARYGLTVGSRLEVEVQGRRAAAEVAGLLRPADPLSRRALEGLVLADIATAQEFTGRLGRLDQIDLILPEDGGAQAAKVARLLPPEAVLAPAAARTGALESITAAFRLNLSALSLLALVVGVFLIYDSMTFSVVRRRRLFGILRCLGATRGQIAALVLGEAVLVGLVGSTLGICLGLLLGQGAVRLVTRTINDLYFVVTVQSSAASPLSLAKGAALGVLATVAAAALPAWEAASSPPQLVLVRSTAEGNARRALPVLTGGGLALLLAGGVTLAIPIRSLPAGFLGLFLVVVGCALLAPIATLALVGLAAPAGRLLGVPGRLAPRSVTGALSRTAVAIAALMMAVSVVVGVGLMVDSFRNTVVIWLQQTLTSDIYISAPSFTSTRSTATLDPQVLEVAGQWPGVGKVMLLRSVTVNSPQGPQALSAVGAPDWTTRRLFVSTTGTPAQVAAAVREGAVVVSEPLANRLSLPAQGGAITLDTDRGPLSFPVVGVYRDYSSSQGTVMMDLPVYRSYWDDTGLTAISLDLEPPAAATAQPDNRVDQVAQALTERLSAVQALDVRPNRALRSDVLSVFDQAFTITGAQQLLAALVAFIGVLSALLALQLERTRELGVLRAIGLTVRQLRGLVFLETGLMGAVAGLLALPTGLALAVILIYIINRRSFGWTMPLQLNPALLGEALLLAVAAALLAGIYPAYRMGRLPAAEALRAE